MALWNAFLAVEGFTWYSIFYKRCKYGTILVWYSYGMVQLCKCTIVNSWYGTIVQTHNCGFLVWYDYANAQLCFPGCLLALALALGLALALAFAVALLAILASARFLPKANVQATRQHGQWVGERLL